MKTETVKPRALIVILRGVTFSKNQLPYRGKFKFVFNSRVYLEAIPYTYLNLMMWNKYKCRN